MTTITRFAPSPTGWLHIGNLRAALFNYAIARQNGGTFILRIDDTDQERSKPEYKEGVRDVLTWLGINWDDTVAQSDRLERYNAARDQLIADGRLYECFETPVELDLKRKKQLNMGKPPVYDRAALSLTEAQKQAYRDEGRRPHWRFKLDLERVEWDDGIMGPISIDCTSVSDPVLIKETGQILYTFASPVDDVDMNITDIVRGSDHVTNTATQIQIMRALGGTVPRFAHHSLLTGPQGEALSKRLGTLALRDLREQGIAAEAVLSLMARLGSSQPVVLVDGIDDVVKGFDIGTFGSAPTKFDFEDLWPLTARHLARLEAGDVADTLDAAGVPADLQPAFWHAVKGNVTKLDDVAPWWDLFRDGGTAVVADEDRDFAAQAFDLLGDPPYAADTWSDWTGRVKDATGRKGKQLFMPLRLAVTGQARGPEMADVMPLLQKKPTL
ncbi:glutamyl-tRNA synthetase [Loktanella sp. DSM 29012]|uniref:glutamate--tRNA ligase n=1 Tax=Loktanella sp. DSM 29012 TaxID=1881056 RepID=UPI0008D8716F|nr:glutamate--tRNA ligase [Loktanella sp. DSM 29012]SEQ64075.1 glutamyl-tRNA synthetase [Loktanella sp. DSM 29012]